MDAGAQGLRLRLLRAPLARERGRRVCELPRADRPDGGRAPGRALEHELVPRLPPQPAAPPEAPRGGDEHEVGPPAGSRGAGAPARLPAPRQTAARLLGVPSVSDLNSWRSLAELEGDPAAEAFREGEFPVGADLPPDAVTRRDFVTLLGATLSLAGLTACRRPEESIVPYVEAPENITPGV